MNKRAHDSHTVSIWGGSWEFIIIHTHMFNIGRCAYVHIYIFVYIIISYTYVYMLTYFKATVAF